MPGNPTAHVPGAAGGVGGAPAATPFSNRRLLLPYAAPYFVYVAVATFSAGRIPAEFSYGLRLVLVSGLLWWGWRWYVPLRGPRSAWGSCAWGSGFGLVGIAAWIVLLRPFVPLEAEPWGAAAFYLRLVSAGVLVPLFEELFVRGYVFRVAYQWGEQRRRGCRDALAVTLDEMSLDAVPPGAWSLAAVGISTLVFAAGHNTPEWPAAIVFGLLMAWLWILRRDLLSCVVAHAVANLVLALYVAWSGEWGLW